MNLKKKLISLLLSASVVTNIMSVSSFALDFNMNFSDFSCEIFKLNQSMRKIICNSADTSIDEKLHFLKSKGFEQIENILVNAPRFPRCIWRDFLKDIKKEMLIIKNSIEESDEIRRDTISTLIYYMACNYLDYLDGFCGSFSYWNICYKTYELFSERAKIQRNYLKYKRFKKMSLFCKGFALITSGNLYLKDSNFYEAQKSFEASYKCFKDIDVDWGMEIAYNGLNYACTKILPRTSIVVFPCSQVEKHAPMLKVPLSCLAAPEKEVIPEKKPVDKPFLLSLWFDEYNSAVKKFLSESQKRKNPCKLELAPLHLEEPLCEEYSFGAQKIGHSSKFKLAPLRLNYCSEPSAKKPRLDE